jgi:hypothetical protein
LEEEKDNTEGAETQSSLRRGSGNEKGGPVESRPIPGLRILSERWLRKIPGAFRNQLAMSTAAVASTAVKTAATAVVAAIPMVAATRIAAVVSITAVVAAADEAVGFPASVAVAAVAIIAIMFVVAATSVVTVAVVTAMTVEAAAVVAAVVPGAGADEDATDEVVRPVVAVRSAGVRIVAVVTISAGRCRPDGAVHGAYSDAHGKLCVGVSRGKKQNS